MFCKVDVTVKSVLCVPVITPEDDCIAVFELHRGIEDEEYTENDLRLVVVMCGWVGSTIYQNEQRITLQKQQELNEYLLDLTKCYFADTMLLDKLITEVVNFAKVALSAEHGLFFVIKPKINDYETYADFYEEGIGEHSNTLYKKNIVLKLGNDADIVSIVAEKGIVINIKNAFKDNRIDQHKRKDYVIRSALCIPIKGIDDVLGVIQLNNKKKGACFTKSDEVLFQTFSVYCGFVLRYARLNDTMAATRNLNNVYTEMLYHQMLPCIHDFYFVSTHPDIPSIPPRFKQFDFYIPDSFEHYMPQLVMYMFNEISPDIFETTNLLAKFVLVIQKSYHVLHFHNYHHAFNVVHCMYNILRRNKRSFTPMEVRALIVSAYCHDVDHYGVSNTFLEITNHYLCQLYEESIAENHHYHVTAFIIKFLKLFTYLSAKEYQLFMDEIKYCIIATDLSVSFKRRGKLAVLCSDKTFNWHCDEHRSLLKSIMMTVTDLSGSCKPYLTSKYITDQMYSEYYNEGDKEKLLGLCPLPIMNRDKDYLIPVDQVQFLNIVLIPCARIIDQLMPNCGKLYEDAVQMRAMWQEIHDMAGQKVWTIDSFPDKKIH